MKKKCALAAAKLIEDGMIIGFGGGSTVRLLIEEVTVAGKQIQAVTPSQDTAEVCRLHGIQVLSLDTVDRIDLAFDGCDELDHDLNAMKSCGGIHTREKLVAAMADQYILLADESKYFTQLSMAYPVTIEVLPCARSYVKSRLDALGGAVTERHCSNKTGLTITDDGNYLMEAKWDDAKCHQVGRFDLKELDRQLNAIPGIVGHGLFYNIATGAIIARSEDYIFVKSSKIKTSIIAADRKKD